MKRTTINLLTLSGNVGPQSNKKCDDVSFSPAAVNNKLVDNYNDNYNELPLVDFETTLFIEGPKEEFNLVAKK